MNPEDIAWCLEFRGKLVRSTHIVAQSELEALGAEADRLYGWIDSEDATNKKFHEENPQSMPYEVWIIDQMRQYIEFVSDGTMGLIRAHNTAEPDFTVEDIRKLMFFNLGLTVPTGA